MADARDFATDEYVVKTLFEDNGAVRGFTILEKQQKQFLTNNQAIDKSNKRLAQSMKAAGVGTGFLKRAFGAFLGFQLVRSIIDTAVETDNLNRSFEAMAGSAEGGAAQMAFVKNEVNDLGLKLNDVAPRFKDIFRTAKTAGLNDSQTQGLFSTMLKTEKAYNLDDSDKQRLSMTMQNILATGKVSNLDSKSMTKLLGLSKEDLAQIKLRSKDTVSYIANLTAEVNKRVGDKASKNANSLESQLNRLRESFSRFLQTIADSGVADTFAKSVSLLSDALIFLEKNIQTVYVALGALAFKRLITMRNVFLESRYAIGSLANAMQMLVSGDIVAGLGAFATASWAAVAPWLKLFAAAALANEFIGLLKGVRTGDYSDSNIVGALNFIEEKTHQGLTKMFGYRGEFVPTLGTKPVTFESAALRPAPAVTSNQQRTNVQNNVNINVNGSNLSQDQLRTATSDAIRDALKFDLLTPTLVSM